ncbi:MAG: type II toxin-antitoxin system mRNA interferase toxin, RelE/StbE family [Cyanobacteria bacterium P01_A01_bin.83]
MERDVEYQVVLTKQATKLFKQIKDRREQKLLLAKLEKLKYNPERQGKALVKELSGYRSVRAVGQRYRIVYQVQANKVLVTVISIGRRKEGDKKDIYTVTKKILDNLESSNDE